MNYDTFCRIVEMYLAYDRNVCIPCNIIRVLWISKVALASFVVLLSLCSCTLVKMLSFTWKM